MVAAIGHLLRLPLESRYLLSVAGAPLLVLILPGVLHMIGPLLKKADPKCLRFALIVLLSGLSGHAPACASCTTSPCASCTTSSIVKSNCSALGVCLADHAAIILGPLLGGGGGPLLDDATVCEGAFDGGRPCSPLPLILNRGIPLDGGSPGRR